ncbi:MAG: peptidoglycan-binding protein [Proteobacteria bacterium]|nr:peptidoglycan-binding protein [Pseudomonadota bacterium]
MKTLLLMRGNTDPKVADLKQALRKTLDKATAAAYPGLSGGNKFDADTEDALRAWQAGVGLVADGIAGPRTLSALGILPPAKLDVAVDTAMVSKLFPFTRASSIAANLPYVTAALAAFGLTGKDMICVALGTIRAETEGFAPIAELPSHFNTLPGQAAFSAYERRLGNKHPGDGARYRGRGYVQLTGLGNYIAYGGILAIPLADNPDSACAPEVAACLLAAFLNENKIKLQAALAKEDLKAARKLVNGGSYGLDRFTDAFDAGQKVWAVAPPLAGAARQAAPAPIAARRAALNVTSDPKDLRDRSYTPPPNSLSPMYPTNDDIKKFMGAYTKAGLILDQGQEGACTGFGLACVINHLRWHAAGMPAKFESVSPRMLYHFARRFDEYEGEDYAGSSCRGALKGWYYNGVCVNSKWPYAAGGDTLPKPGWDSDAVERTLGVYYRIDLQTITDLQAAIQEVGAIYVSSYTHKGWDAVTTSTTPPASHDDLPVIPYDGKPSRKGGHSFALVGFNRSGFVMQNSWGNNWGAGGFAVISYADWLAHAMDAWIAAMGVPGVVSGRLASGGGKQTAAAAGAAHTNWWDEEKAYRHSIVLGNNGHVNHFDKLDEATRTLQHQACVMPGDWFRENRRQKKRIVIYAHGGLNSEASAIQRAQAMGRYFMGNGCYPLFLVWKSGLLESIGDVLADKFESGTAEKAGGIRDWINDKITDPIVEKTIGRPFARPLWTEMKENAELASESGRGGDLLTDALRALAGTWGSEFEIHLIGHSAGSIMLGRLLNNLAQKNLTGHVKTVHLYAPACTVAFANRYYAPHKEIMNNLYLDILADQKEQDDNVATLYQKSLLYFISNALEADSQIPILGLANVYDPKFNGWDGTPSTAEALINWRTAMENAGLVKRRTIHDEERFTTRSGNGAEIPQQTESPSHGGFDNNIEVIGETLKRIVGAAALDMPVDDLVGF